MGILSWIVMGLIAGWLAGLVVDRRGRGLAGDVILGVVGAIAGGILAGALFGISDAITKFDLSTLVVAFLGAVVVVAMIRALPGRSPV